MEIGNKDKEVAYSAFVGNPFQSLKLKLSLLSQSWLHYMLMFPASSVELAAQKNSVAIFHYD